MGYRIEDDLISRQQAIEAISVGILSAGVLSGWDIDSKLAVKEIIRAINCIPAAQPEQQTGHWIEWLDFDNEGTWECSVCKEPWTLIAGTPIDNGMKYCPNCGARMEGDTDETD